MFQPAPPRTLTALYRAWELREEDQIHELCKPVFIRLVIGHLEHLTEAFYAFLVNIWVDIGPKNALGVDLLTWVLIIYRTKHKQRSLEVCSPPS